MSARQGVDPDGRAASAAGLIGIAAAYGLYGKGPSEPRVARFTSGGAGQGLYQASLEQAVGRRGLRDFIIVKPFRFLARGLFEIVDPRFMIDTVLVNGSAFAVTTFSRLSRWIQNGMVQRYLVGIVIGPR